jgi:ABC-2 type transport system permease protein
MSSSLRTILVLAKINTRRYFRDKLALFFTVVFPLIFLFVFGGLFGKGGSVSFKVAVINQSQTEPAKQFVDAVQKNTSLFKIDEAAINMDKANEKMSRSEIDAIIVLPPEFGQKNSSQVPAGQVMVYYSQNNDQVAPTLSSVLDIQLKQLNGQYDQAELPFTVTTKASNLQSLSRFDYVFAGLLGFSIVGLGIFGPVNVFPELKKQGVLRRFHTTPLKVWQYFISNVFSQTVIGMFAVSIMFIVAALVFDLRIAGNIFALALFVALSIVTIFGIGLAIGGWARNERQAAPLANIIVFPMLFLSGTFFPRFVMPEWLQQASSFLPLTPVIDGIRLIATEGKTLIEVGPQIAMLFGWMVVIYLIAFKVFRWE